MFSFSIKEAAVVTIENCPKTGVEALDFRRLHQLPEGTNNKVTIPDFEFTSEEFGRELLSRGFKGSSYKLGYLEFTEKLDYHWGYLGTAAPEKIRDYIAHPTTETAVALILDTFDSETREAKAIAAARKLLSEEIQELTKRAEKAESKVKYLEGEIEELKAAQEEYAADE